MLIFGLVSSPIVACNPKSPKCSPSPTPTPSVTLDGFVRRNGVHLTINGSPFIFKGLNIYNANSRNNCWYSLGNNDDELQKTLTSSGVKTFRAWFTNGLALVNGVRDWTAFDHTLAVAKSQGVKVIPVLSVEDCRGDGVRYTTWFESGYKATFRSYVSEIVARYKNNPTILMWQIGNEFEIKNIDGTCGSVLTMKAFADDMSGLIKSIDSNHLVSLGTIGSGQCGARGSQEYRNLHSSPNIDLCEYHDYSSPSSPMPGDQWNGLQTRINDCTALNKPLFVGEAGIVQTDPNRTIEFANKITAQFSAGVVGFIPWEWRAANQTGGDTYIIGPNDSLLSLLH